jgi:hypothetical protein
MRGNNTIQSFVAVDKNSPVIWMEGAMVNVGDVNSMTSLTSAREENSINGTVMIVVGEGFQSFFLRG